MAPGQVPFALTCNVTGRGRWVTTTIYRFDITMGEHWHGWPPDLSCLFKWNTGLKAFDGVSSERARAGVSVA